MAVFEYSSENIFEVESNMLLNPVNCKGVSGAGLALAFKRKFPEAQREYETTCRKEMWITDPTGTRRKVAAFRPGDLLHFIGINRDYLMSEDVKPEDLLSKKQHLVYFPTKNHYKDPSKYEYVEKGLKSLVGLLSQDDINSSVSTISIPALGCGLGGLRWEKVEVLIKDALSPLEKTFILFPPQ